MMSDSIKTPRILVVSRDAAILDSLRAVATAHAWQIEIAAEAWEAIDRVQSASQLDLLLLDQLKDRTDSLQLLRALHRIRAALPVILIGHTEDADHRQESIRMGARDYLTRPLDDHQFALVVRSNLSAAHEGAEIDLTSEDIESVGHGKFFIGISPVTKRLREQIALLAEADNPVFLFGEPGSGRETIARLLHRLSVRSGFEFAKVNCAALPEDLLEREIFGVDRRETPRAKRGKLELCHQGVVLLEEITEMPLRLQAELAQVLQDGRPNHGEASTGLQLDVRLIAASNMSIDQAVSERRLHRALVRLFGAYELKVPSLRERKDEVPFLSRYFMHRIARRYGLPPREFTPAVSEAWQAHNWPGNLRELEQAVKRHLVAGGKTLDFESNMVDAKNGQQESAGAQSRYANGTAVPRQLDGICGYKSLKAFLQSVKEEAERSAIALALERTGWNRKAAARMLKTSYRSVLYKIEQYQMQSPTTSASRTVSEYGRKRTEFGGLHQDNAAAIDLSRTADGT